MTMAGDENVVSSVEGLMDTERFKIVFEKLEEVRSQRRRGRGLIERSVTGRASERR
jgi:hypothetical protein